MKYKDQPLSIKATGTVELPRTDGPNLTFTVAALPIGVDRMYDAVYPRPTAPFKLKVSKAEGETRVYDDNDPAFLKAVGEYISLKKYYLVYLALTHKASEVSFEHQPTNPESLRAMVEEMRQAGFSDGDLNVIFNRVMDLSNVNAGDIAAAKKSF